MIWVKQSPYQKKIAEFRKAARENGLSVRRCRRPDFREGENRLVSVCYEISTTYKEDDMKFCIHRVSNAIIKATISKKYIASHRAAN